MQNKKKKNVKQELWSGEFILLRKLRATSGCSTYWVATLEKVGSLRLDRYQIYAEVLWKEFSTPYI